MNLGQNVQGPLLRRVHELACLAVAQYCHDQENAVGTERPRLRHLVGVEGEVLAQHRQGNGRARRAQVAVPALEIGLVGEHRQASGAALLVGAGEG